MPPIILYYQCHTDIVHSLTLFIAVPDFVLHNITLNNIQMILFELSDYILSISLWYIMALVMSATAQSGYWSKWLLVNLANGQIGYKKAFHLYIRCDVPVEPSYFLYTLTRTIWCFAWWKCRQKKTCSNQLWWFAFNVYINVWFFWFVLWLLWKPFSHYVNSIICLKACQWTIRTQIALIICKKIGLHPLPNNQRT